MSNHKHIWTIFQKPLMVHITWIDYSRFMIISIFVLLLNMQNNMEHSSFLFCFCMFPHSQTHALDVSALIIKNLGGTVIVCDRSLNTKMFCWTRPTLCWLACVEVLVCVCESKWIVVGWSGWNNDVPVRITFVYRYVATILICDRLLCIVTPFVL